MKARARAVIRSASEELAMLDARRAIAINGWNGDDVLFHLVAAFRTLRKLPDKARHKAIRSVWPDDAFAKEPDSLETERFAAEVAAIELGDEEVKARHAEQNRSTIPPTPIEISQMNEALAWPARYIEERHLRVIVMTCSVVRASNRSLHGLCRDRGWPYSTTYMRAIRAGRSIAAGLNRDGVATW